ncbi:MAG: methyltransferase domain-containing protein [Alphaproteobacteria bacterium]
MATQRKTRSVNELFEGFGATFRHYLYDRPRAYFEVIHRRVRNMPLTNFELGCKFAERGQWMDAVFRFRLALWLQPNFAQAWYNLGACYVRLGNRPRARYTLMKALALAPQHSDAIYLLSGIDPNAVPAASKPTRMSAATVTHFFTMVAPRYEERERALGYNGPQLVYDAAKPLVKPAGAQLLDVGCGSGLAARPWRANVAGITGIDLTPAMLDLARAAKAGDLLMYERLIENDIITLPDELLPAAGFDLAICCNVSQFLGDLYPPLVRIKRLLRPGAVLALTYEPMGTSAGFAVNPDSGRFGHHPDYVKRMALHVGFEPKRELKFSFYADSSAALSIFAVKE